MTNFLYELNKLQGTFSRRLGHCNELIGKLESLTFVNGTQEQCWPVLINPFSLEIFRKGVCISNKADIDQNARKLQIFNSQIENYEKSLVKLTAIIQAAPDSSVRILFFGSISYLTQMGKDNPFISYLIGANIVGALTFIFSCAGWCSKRFCCRRDRRESWMSPLRGLRNFCCETLEAAPPPHRGSQEQEQEQEFPLMERGRAIEAPRVDRERTIEAPRGQLALTYQQPRPNIQD